MDLARLGTVVEICLPVFALIGVGVWLRRSGRMDDQHQRFLAWFINELSLPALIFVGVARRDRSAALPSRSNLIGPRPVPRSQHLNNHGLLKLSIHAQLQQSAARRDGARSIAGNAQSHPVIARPDFHGCLEGNWRLLVCVNHEH